MKRRSRRIGIALLLSGLLLFAAACGGGVDRSLPQYASERQFRFAAYVSPPPAGVGSGTLANNPSYITVKDYEVMKACGFNYTYSGYLRSEQDVLDALRVCDEVGGIKYLVRDDADLNAMLYDEGGADWTAAKANVARKWEKYSAYESFAGAMAIDEPNAKYFANIRAVKDWYEETFPDSEYNTNLLPNWAAASQLGTADYDAYVNGFLETVAPDQLSYDYYPFVDRNGKPTFFKSQYFTNLETIAAAAKENGLPFYVYLQTHPHLGYSEMTHYSDVAFQVYAPMAFGCAGAQTFTYWTLMQDGQTAVVDSYGRPTACYYALQEVIREVRAMEQVYFNFDWQGTLAYEADEDKPNVSLRAMKKALSGHERLARYASSEDMVIGAFKSRDGRDTDAFLVTNVSLPADRKTATVELTFTGAKRAVIYAKGRAFVRALDKTGSLTLTVGPGEGWFVIPD